MHESHQLVSAHAADRVLGAAVNKGVFAIALAVQQRDAAVSVVRYLHNTIYTKELSNFASYRNPSRRKHVVNNTDMLVLRMEKLPYDLRTARKKYKRLSRTVQLLMSRLESIAWIPYVPNVSCVLPMRTQPAPTARMALPRAPSLFTTLLYTCYTANQMSYRRKY